LWLGVGTAAQDIGWGLSGDWLETVWRLSAQFFCQEPKKLCNLHSEISQIGIMLCKKEPISGFWLESAQQNERSA